MSKQNRKPMDLKTKLAILQDFEKNCKVRDICKKYDVKRSNIYKLKLNKNKIEDFASNASTSTMKFKKNRTSSFPELEAQLYSWFLRERELKNIVSNELLMIKAKEIFHTLQVQSTDKNFSCSDGWLNNFKKRHGIRILTLAGEKGSCDESVIPVFLRNFQNILAENGYDPEQIYNCDETGLVFKGLPRRTNVSSNEKTAPGKKVPKERVTIMPCVNATGNHKLPLMMIGKSAKPRCFKGISVPLYYRSSKNAWQTTTLFKEWFKNEFVPQVKAHLESKGLPPKALLIVDNASSHGTSEVLEESEDIKILYLPPNMTAYLQPLDQHIIKSLKMRYRSHLLTTLASKSATIDVALKSLNLKDVVFLITEAWNEVPISVITNGFKHLFADQIELNLPAFHFTSEDDIPLVQLYNNVVANNESTEADIMEWASGEQDPERLDKDTEDISASVEETEDHDSPMIEISKVIESFNTVIEWSENGNLTIQEILLLRRMREKAVMAKFA